MKNKVDYETIELLVPDNQKIHTLEQLRKNRSGKLVVSQKLLTMASYHMKNMRFRLSSIGSDILRFDALSGSISNAKRATNLTFDEDDLLFLEVNPASLDFGEFKITGLILSKVTNGYGMFLYGNAQLYQYIKLLKHLFSLLRVDLFNTKSSIPEVKEEMEESMNYSRDSIADSGTSSFLRKISTPEIVQSMQLEVVRAQEKERLVLEENSSLKSRIRSMNIALESSIKENEQLKSENSDLYEQILEITNQARMSEINNNSLIGEINSRKQELVEFYEDQLLMKEKSLYDKLIPARTKENVLLEQIELIKQDLHNLSVKYRESEERKAKLMDILHKKDEQFSKLSMEFTSLSKSYNEAKCATNELHLKLSSKMDSSLQASSIKGEQKTSDSIERMSPSSRDKGGEFRALQIVKNFVKKREKMFVSNIKKDRVFQSERSSNNTNRSILGSMIPDKLRVNQNTASNTGSDLQKLFKINEVLSRCLQRSSKIGSQRQSSKGPSTSGMLIDNILEKVLRLYKSKFGVHKHLERPTEQYCKENYHRDIENPRLFESTTVDSICNSFRLSAQSDKENNLFRVNYKASNLIN